MVRIHKDMEPVFLMVLRHIAQSQAEAGWPLSSRKPLARGRVIELVFADFLSGPQPPIGSRCARVDAAAALLLSLNAEELQLLREKLDHAYDNPDIHT